jgi:UDP-glucose:(heptosyl)LPS alpha-1,3-glucosyltransferase
MSGALGVIPNGVDLGNFRFDARARHVVRERAGIGPADLAAVFVGGDWGRKGLATAIEAIGRSPAWRLLVVGGGDEQAHQDLAERVGAGGRVHFCGRTADPAPFYSAADAFLLPSAYETFSLVTYEAAAAGLPLLVTRVSGVEDVLIDGENGWFIERDPDLVAERLDRLAASEEARRAMGDAARVAVAEYGWDRVVDRYDTLYRELAAEGSA